jgi:DNA-binding NtrC family response regulator
MARLLVVDDDPQVCELVTKMAYRLVGNAVEVRSATTHTEAVRLQRAHPADVLLSDYFMPDLDGPVLARELTALKPNLRTVLMTGDAAIVGKTVPEACVPVRDKAQLDAVVDEAVQLALEGL